MCRRGREGLGKGRRKAIEAEIFQACNCSRIPVSREEM